MKRIIVAGALMGALASPGYGKKGVSLGASETKVTAEGPSPWRVHALAGRKWTEFESAGVQTFEVTAAAYRQLGDLPLAIGPNISIQKYRDADLAGADRLEGYQIGLEGYLWLPKKYNDFANLTPYIKYREVLLGDTKAEGPGGYRATIETPGQLMSYGLRYEVIPEAQILFEYVTGDQKAKTKRESSDAVETRKGTTVAMDSKALLVGTVVKL